MRRTEYAAAGSQRWLQLAVAKAPDQLHEALAQAGAVRPGEKIEWKAPIAENGFAEPRDNEALRLAGIESLPVRSLATFWPRRGPVWDAVARVGQAASLFVEAKAHVAEAASPPSQASPNSLEKIREALSEARSFYAPDSTADWHRVFYQYANRLAHHYLLWKVNGLDSRPVFLQFLNARDVSGPTSAAEWEAATKVIHDAPGLPARLEGMEVFHAYFDTNGLVATR